MTKVKPTFGDGLFIRKDRVGQDCNIGDIVQVITDGYYEDGNDFEVKDEKVIGKLLLSKNKGIYLYVSDRWEKGDDDDYFKSVKMSQYNRVFSNLKVTENTRRGQEWLVILKKKGNKYIQ